MVFVFRCACLWYHWFWWHLHFGCMFGMRCLFLLLMSLLLLVVVMVIGARGGGKSNAILVWVTLILDPLISECYFSGWFQVFDFSWLSTSDRLSNVAQLHLTLADLVFCWCWGFFGEWIMACRWLWIAGAEFNQHHFGYGVGSQSSSKRSLAALRSRFGRWSKFVRLIPNLRAPDDDGSWPGQVDLTNKALVLFRTKSCGKPCQHLSTLHSYIWSTESLVALNISWRKGNYSP